MKNPFRIKGGNWGLKALSLVLAIAIYYFLKTDFVHKQTASSKDAGNDRQTLQQH